MGGEEVALLSQNGANLRCPKHTSLSSTLSRVVTLQSHCGVSQCWKGKHNVGEASTHMVGLSEGSVMAAQLLALARTGSRANRRPRAPQLNTQKLHQHQPLESSLPSPRKLWKRQLRFDELVGTEEWV